MDRDILSEACRSCRHWSHSGAMERGATSGFCRQWSPYDYWPRRGARSKRFVVGVGPGVFTKADDWCAKYSEKPNSSRGDYCGPVRVIVMKDERGECSNWSCPECGEDADGCYCAEDAEPKEGEDVIPGDLALKFLHEWGMEILHVSWGQSWYFPLLELMEGADGRGYLRLSDLELAKQRRSDHSEESPEG